MRRSLLILLTALPLVAGAAPVWAAASSPYLLPFPSGASVYVTQGNSEGNHEAANGEQYAFDFVVAGGQTPTGTDVVAARAGTVIGAQSGSSGAANLCATWMCWTQAAFVLVDHGDGTSALYEFVNPKVNVGDHIVQGERVGGLKESGMSVAAHVLFQVETTPPTSKTPGWWHTSSLPVTFADPGVVAKVPDGIPTRERGPYAPSVAESIPSTPPIDKVPLDPSGRLEMEAYSVAPYYVISGRGTVTAEAMDSTTGVLWLAVTFPGNKIARQNCQLNNINGHDVNLCTYTGFTAWATVKDKTAIMSPNNKILGYGPSFLMQETAVGRFVMIGMGVNPTITDSPVLDPAEEQANLTAFLKLEKDVGQSFPRAQKVFVFTPGIVDVYPLETPSPT